MGKPAFLEKVWKTFIWNGSTQEVISPVGDFNDFIFEPNASGEAVTVETGKRLTAVYNSINIIAQSIAAFPWTVKINTKEGKFDATDHSAYNKVKNRPNRFMNSVNFYMLIIKHLLARGNAYVLIDKDSAGNIQNLWPLDPAKMQITSYEDEIFYKYQGIKDALLPEQVLHFRLNTKDGIVGLSPIMENAETMGAHIKQNRYSIKMLGEKPPGYLAEKYTGGVGGNKGKSKAEANIDNWKRQIREKGIPYLYGDIEYRSTMIPPDEAQYLGSRKATRLEIFGIFRTPPELHQIFEDSNNSVSESTRLNFGMFCLTPIVVMMENEMTSKLFGYENEATEEPLYVKANMRALYRADMKTTGEFYKTMVGAGIWNADRVLSLEDENPQPDGQGKVYYIQSAFMPKHLADQFWQGKSGQVKNPNEEKSAAQLMDEYIRAKNKEDEE